ncbi:DUF4233 domain-containing protein [Demequina litorisediminis]|uniref:DUF4233 domain-containing protein n=1 Tax=Demequina litorisediminis TaxID=1849022 RepID=A0ABQ6IIK9_9MICO|nr:DUF4233 domain-containing protein [Demequina litorisediminis]GMA36992.1 hypothetical protein GCM10025876_31960 [Demequina litorisediminis]
MTDQTSEPAVASAPRKPLRSAQLTFRQTVLLCEAFTMFFATLLGFGLVQGGSLDAPAGLIIGGGLALTVLMGWSAGAQSKSWGVWLGWGMQVPLLAAGVVDTAITIMGAVFLVLWIAALRIGGRIDRERAERDVAFEERLAAQEREAAQPEVGESPA